MGTRTVTSEGLEPASWGDPQPVMGNLSVSSGPISGSTTSNVTLALGLPEREQRALDSLPSRERDEALDLLDTLETTTSRMVAGNAYDRLSLLFGFDPTIPPAAVDSYRLAERGPDVSGLRPITHPEHYVRSAGALWDDVRDTSFGAGGVGGNGSGIK